MAQAHDLAWSAVNHALIIEAGKTTAGVNPTAVVARARDYVQPDALRLAARPRHGGDTQQLLQDLAQKCLSAG